MSNKLMHFIQRILPSSKSQVNNQFDVLNQQISGIIAKVDALDFSAKEQNSLLKMNSDELEILEDKMSGITSKIDALTLLAKEQNSLLTTNSDKLEILEDEISNITSLEKEIKYSINNMERVIPKAYLYNNQYEYRVTECFHAAYQSDDYKTKFLELIKGLDSQNIQKIVTILRRQQLVWEKHGKDIDFYTQSEQTEIRELQKYMLNHIFQVSDQLFCYDHYFLPIRHFEASVFYFKHGIHELKKDSIERVKGKDIVDVGGYIGDSVLILEELCPKTIYTFEGVRENFELINKTLLLNNIQNCVAEHMALGEKAGRVTFDVKGTSSNMQTIDYIEQVEYQESVEVTTLDAYVNEHNMDIGLIKVDIEGAEQLFLRGARKTIEKFRPVLLLSIYHNADDFFGIKPMIDSWNLGYQFHIHKPCDYSISREVLLICEPADIDA